jgi:hypothetical protein
MEKEAPFLNREVGPLCLRQKIENILKVKIKPKMEKERWFEYQGLILNLSEM